MISFKSFVNAIQDAIVHASDVLVDKNLSLIDKYFIQAPKTETDATNPDAQPAPASALIPKTVTLQYPHLNSNGHMETLNVAVPLITLAPLSMSKLEKATLSAHFEMEVVDDSLQLHFGHKNQSNGGMFSKKPKTSWGKIDITFSPQEPSDGFQLLIDGYEAILKKQIS